MPKSHSQSQINKYYLVGLGEVPPKLSEAALEDPRFNSGNTVLVGGGWFEHLNLDYPFGELPNVPDGALVMPSTASLVENYLKDGWTVLAVDDGLVELELTEEEPVEGPVLESPQKVFPGPKPPSRPQTPVPVKEKPQAAPRARVDLLRELVTLLVKEAPEGDLWNALNCLK